MLSGENGSTWIKTCPSATLSTNRKRTGLNSNTQLHHETRATQRLVHGTASTLCLFFEGHGVVCDGVPYFDSFDAKTNVS
jgi:hypothetical protein